MKNSKHTPAPWKVISGLFKGKINIADLNSKPICEIFEGEGKKPSQESINEAFANAKLIAKSPELLEALIEAKHKLIVLDNNTPQLHSTDTENLINKIEGLIQSLTPDNK